jgi:hypothetical protein
MAESPVGFPSRDTSSRGQSMPGPAAASGPAVGAPRWRRGCRAPAGRRAARPAPARPPSPSARDRGATKLPASTACAMNQSLTVGVLTPGYPSTCSQVSSKFPPIDPTGPTGPTRGIRPLSDTVDGQGHRRPRSRACQLRIGRKTTLGPACWGATSATPGATHGDVALGG